MSFEEFPSVLQATYGHSVSLRDEIVQIATAGETSHNGVRYKTVATAQTNLLIPGTVIDGLPINHG